MVRRSAPALDAGALTRATWLGLPALAAGALAGLGLAATEVGMRPDRALVLTGLLAVPAPLLVLLWLPSPPNAPLRRALGETVERRLRATVRLLLRALLASLGLPLGIGMVALLRPEQAADLERFALCALLGSAGALLGGVATTAWALTAIGAARTDRFEKLAGGGVYGPALIAPLLYAPAIGYAAGMMPVGLLVATWAGLPEPPGWQLLARGVTPVLAVYAWLALRGLRSLQPHAATAWLRMEEALATPFAYDRSRPEPPSWLAGPGALGQLLGRAWVRRHPLPAAAPLVTALGLALLLPRDSGDFAFAVIGVGVGALAATRGAAQALREPEVAAAARFCGADPGALRSAEARLGDGLALPALLAALGLGWVGPVVAGPVGVLAGALFGRVLSRHAGAAATRNAGRALFAAATLAALLAGALPFGGHS